MAAMLNVAAYHFTPLADPGGLAAELRRRLYPGLAFPAVGGRP